MKQLVLLLIAGFLLTGTFADAKRSLGRGSSSRSSSSSSSSRRVSSVTHRPATQSRPATHRPAPASAPAPSYNSNSHAGGSHQQQPSSNIGWNTNQNKPQGPPAYSAHNPAGGASPYNNKPPSYNSANNNNAPIRAQTQRPIQSSYPKQALPGNSYPHNSNVPLNAGPPKYYPVGSAPSVGYHPAGSVGGGYHPPAGGATYYPAGHAPAAGYHPGGYGGGGYHPQAPPVYAPPGVQPGYYPAGSFPQQKTNTGPGLGTGLIVGALGGAVLGHALTPSHNSYGGGGGGGGYSNNGHSDSDRVIIINNTPGQPATVTTQDGHQPIIVNNTPNQAAPNQPDAPVPLAPFQPGSTQVVNPPAPGDQMTSAAGVSPPLVHTPNSSVPPGQTYPDGTVPLAPIIDSSNTTVTEAPKSGGVMCYPVLVNVTSETDPTNITTVEQIACYEVPAGYDPNAPQQEQSTTGSATMSQKPDLMQMPGGSEQITQRTSTATLAESSQIKQNGALGQHSAFSTITSTIAAIIIAYSLQ